MQHIIPHQLGLLNYTPFEVGGNVDTLRIDFVMFVADPNSVGGGEFGYYRDTMHEMG